jgi:hypothetical protein
VSAPRCTSPRPLGDLSDYWLGELSAAVEAPLEEHLVGCDECSRRLAWVVDLAAATGALAKRGLLRVVVSDEHLGRLAREGLQLREYRVALGGSVSCTIAPEDDLVVARLAAPFASRERLDLVFCDATGHEEARLADVAVDPTRHEIVFTEPVDGLRRLGVATLRVRLVDVAESGERVLGEYTFNHAPWTAH